MKYLITESKLGDVIHKFLDSQDFVITETENSIFFSYHEFDLYSQIKIDLEDNFCELNFEIVNDISSLFSIHRNDSIYYITEWVGDKLGIQVSETFAPRDYYRIDMKVPK